MRAFANLRSHRPSAWAQLLALALLVCTLQVPTAQAHEMQLQDYGLWSFYQFSHEGKPTGSVTRSRWRQPLRLCYVSYDTSGELTAYAKQTGVLHGRLMRRNAEIMLVSAYGERIGRLVGDMWAPYAASFELHNSQDAHVAQITMDAHGQIISVRDPSNWHQVLGYATRVQQATRGTDSWVLAFPEDTVAVDGRVWPLIGAFFGESWGVFAFRHDEG